MTSITHAARRGGRGNARIVDTLATKATINSTTGITTPSPMIQRFAIPAGTSVRSPAGVPDGPGVEADHRHHEEDDDEDVDGGTHHQEQPPEPVIRSAAGPCRCNKRDDIMHDLRAVGHPPAGHRSPWAACPRGDVHLDSPVPKRPPPAPAWTTTNTKNRGSQFTRSRPSALTETYRLNQADVG